MSCMYCYTAIALPHLPKLQRWELWLDLLLSIDKMLYRWIHSIHGHPVREVAEGFGIYVDDKTSYLRKWGQLFIFTEITVNWNQFFKSLYYSTQPLSFLLENEGGLTPAEIQCTLTPDYKKRKNFAEWTSDFIFIATKAASGHFRLEEKWRVQDVAKRQMLKICCPAQ